MKIEPLGYASPVSPMQWIRVAIPDWDSGSMVGKTIVAQCYVHPKSKRCEIIRTEKGLLIRL